MPSGKVYLNWFSRNICPSAHISMDCAMRGSIRFVAGGSMDSDGGMPCSRMSAGSPDAGTRVWPGPRESRPAACQRDAVRIDGSAGRAGARSGERLIRWKSCGRRGLPGTHPGQQKAVVSSHQARVRRLSYAQSVVEEQCAHCAGPTAWP